MDKTTHLILQDHEAQREELLRQFPSLADDPETLADTLEGISDLPGRLEALVLKAQHYEALADVCAERVNALRAQIARHMDRAEKIKNAVLDAYLAAGFDKPLRMAEVTIGTAKVPPKVIVTDPAALPDAFKIVPPAPAPKPDLKAIKDALAAGQDVPGATLSNGSVRLNIR